MDEVRNQLWEYVWNISNYYVDKTYGWFLVYSWNVSYEWVDYTYNCKVLNKDKVKLELQEIPSKKLDEEQYIEERTKTLKDNPWDWVSKDNVYNQEWLKTLDSWLWVYPYSNFSSKSINNLIFLNLHLKTD